MKLLLWVTVVVLGVSALCSGGIAAAQTQEETKPATTGGSAAGGSTQTDAVPVAEPADRSRMVYVSDFEVDLAASKDGKSAPVTVTPSAPASSGSGSAQQEAKRDESPGERASRFVDFVSATLVRELEKEGYAARRLHAGETRPNEGIRISGVFAEPDEENRLRRAAIGGGPSVGQMALFVSIGNLARPDQPLYAVVDPKTATNYAGPVITVSAYAPVARFEMPKNVTEKAVRDAATSIVTDLTQLLHTNVAAMTR